MIDLCACRVVEERGHAADAWEPQNCIRLNTEFPSRLGLAFSRFFEVIWRQFRDNFLADLRGKPRKTSKNLDKTSKNLDKTSIKPRKTSKNLEKPRKKNSNLDRNSVFSRIQVSCRDGPARSITSQAGQIREA